MAQSTVDSIAPENDPRVKHCEDDVNGINYHYLLAVPPSGKFENTIFLMHGWPDLSYGWRYQVPFLLDLGFRVVVPDLVGYGRTDAPSVPPTSNLHYYSFKRAADDVKTLADRLGCGRIVLGGHDWGGAVVYRIALWYPSLVSALFVVCTPYWAPTKEYKSLEEAVNTNMPNFRYQLQLASGEVEKRIRTREEIKQFLNGLYGGWTEQGLLGFTTDGTLFENLPKLNQTKLMSTEGLDVYAGEYERNGIHGSLNWYRTRDRNFEDELQLENTTIDLPLLFIQATRDAYLPPWMSEKMGDHCFQLTKKSVEASHWALWQAAAAVNGFVRDWWKDVDAREKAKSHL